MARGHAGAGAASDARQAERFLIIAARGTETGVRQPRGASPPADNGVNVELVSGGGPASRCAKRRGVGGGG